MIGIGTLVKVIRTASKSTVISAIASAAFSAAAIAVPAVVAKAAITIGDKISSGLVEAANKKEKEGEIIDL